MTTLDAPPTPPSLAPLGWAARAALDAAFFCALAPADAPLAQLTAEEAERFLAPQLAHLPTGATALDFGAGVGRWLPELARSGLEVTGYEPEAILCALAQEAHPQWPTHSEAPTPGQADFILAVGVLDTLPDGAAERARDLLAASLRPGGRALLALWTATDEAPGGPVPPDADLMPRAAPLDHWAAWLAAAGLRVREVQLQEPDGLFMWPRAWLTVERGAAEPFEAPRVPPGEAALALEFESLLLQHLFEVRQLQGDLFSAQAAVEQLCRLRPDTETAWLAWAQMRLAQDDLKGSEILLEACTTHCPQAVDAWMIRAQVAHERGDRPTLQACIAQLTALPLDDVQRDQWTQIQSFFE